MNQEIIDNLKDAFSAFLDSLVVEQDDRNTEQSEQEVEETDLSSLSLKELRQMAVDAGGDPADIKGASKDELIEFLSDENESEGDDDDDEEEEDESDDDDEDDEDADESDDEEEDDFDAMTDAELKSFIREKGESVKRGSTRDDLLDLARSLSDDEGEESDDEEDEDEDEAGDDDEEYTRDELEAMELDELRALAKEYGIKTLRKTKEQLVEEMLEEDE